MKNFIKRLSIEALKSGFRHYRDDTLGKIRENLADRYESLADKVAVIFRRLWLAILISSFCSSGVVLFFLGLFITVLPIIFKEELINNYAALGFGIGFMVIGALCVAFPVLTILGLTRKETVHEMLEVDDVRKKLTK